MNWTEMIIEIDGAPYNAEVTPNNRVHLTPVNGGRNKNISEEKLVGDINSGKIGFYYKSDLLF